MNSKESVPLQLFKFYSNRDIKVLKDRDMDYLDNRPYVSIRSWKLNVII